MSPLCAFCGRGEHDTALLVVAEDGRAAICRECVGECAGAMAAFARFNKTGRVPLDKWRARARLPAYLADDDPGDAA